MMAQTIVPRPLSGVIARLDSVLVGAEAPTRYDQRRVYIERFRAALSEDTTCIVVPQFKLPKGSVDLAIFSPECAIAVQVYTHHDWSVNRKQPSGNGTRGFDYSMVIDFSPQADDFQNRKAMYEYVKRQGDIERSEPRYQDFGKVADHIGCFTQG